VTDAGGDSEAADVAPPDSASIVGRPHRTSSDLLQCTSYSSIPMGHGQRGFLQRDCSCGWLSHLRNIAEFMFYWLLDQFYSAVVSTPVTGRLQKSPQIYHFLLFTAICNSRNA
jgi:hypothetical protein